MNKFKDSNLEIIEEFSTRQSSGKLKYFVKVQCFCGKIFVTRKDGRAKSCGCITSELNRTRRLGKPALNRVDSAEKLKKKASEKVYKESSYNDGDISYEMFLELSQKNCHYCNCEPSNKKHLGRNKKGEPRKSYRKDKNGAPYHGTAWGSYLGDEATFVYNGLDRIDSSKTHTLENVVPCCKICNWMKSNHTLDKFLDQIKRIYEWSILRKEN